MVVGEELIGRDRVRMIGADTHALLGNGAWSDLLRFWPQLSREPCTQPLTSSHSPRRLSCTTSLVSTAANSLLLRRTKYLPGRLAIHGRFWVLYRCSPISRIATLVELTRNAENILLSLRWGADCVDEAEGQDR